jgi:hypothetical protein
MHGVREEHRASTLTGTYAKPAPFRQRAAVRFLDARRLETALRDLRTAVADSWDTTSPRYMGFHPRAEGFPRPPSPTS